MANSAALSAWQRTFADPGAEQLHQGARLRSEQYRYYWHWYANSVYEDLATWYGYRSEHRLYRHIRSIYNPARRLVDFYASAVYPGMLSEDAARLPSGVQLAIPFGEDTNPQILAAVAQFWQWSNWQTRKSLMVRYSASVGAVLVEVDDDIASGKVAADIVWPGWVAELSLDRQGNVKSYTLQYDVRKSNGEMFTYRKIVDGMLVQTFRDGAPFGYDSKPAEFANPYGFAPAVWVRHLDLGGDFGAPCYRNLGKWDELNMTASMLHDHLYKVMAAPVIVGGSGAITLLTGQAKGGATQDQVVSDQESMSILKGPADVTIATIPLDIEQAYGAVDRMIAEIEADHPELTMYRELRKMSQVTGPAAQRLMGDVAGMVLDAQANYDQQSIKLFQMALAIGGWRARSGAWGRALTPQQSKFGPFDLTSYARGELDLTVLLRPLIPPIADENAVSRAQVVQALTSAGAGIGSAARVAGYTDDQAQELEGGEIVSGIQQ